MNAQGRLLLAATLAVASMVFVSHQLWREASSAVAPAGTVLVRMQKLTGLDAETENRCCIRANAACSSRYDLAQIGIRLDARRQRIPDGVYRDLKIELANGFHVSGAEGRPIHTQFKPKGDATVLRMSGTLLVENGTARPRALARYGARGRRPGRLYRGQG